MRDYVWIVLAVNILLGTASAAQNPFEDSDCWETTYTTAQDFLDQFGSASDPQFTYTCPTEGDIANPTAWQDCVSDNENCVLDSGFTYNQSRAIDAMTGLAAFLAYEVQKGNVLQGYLDCTMAGNPASLCEEGGELVLCQHHAAYRMIIDGIMEKYTGDPEDDGDSGLKGFMESKFQMCMDGKDDACVPYGDVAVCGYMLKPKGTPPSLPTEAPAVPTCTNDGVSQSCLDECAADFMIAMNTAENAAEAAFQAAHDSYKCAVTQLLIAHAACTEEPIQCCALFNSRATTAEITLCAANDSASGDIRDALAAARMEFTNCNSKCCAEAGNDD